MFRFLDPGRLVDGDLELILVEKRPGSALRVRVPAYKFEMRLMGTERRVGHIDLRIGDLPHLVMYGGQIGYGVDPPYRGHHYAARSVRLLLPLARAHGMTTVWITCNPENVASRRTCELAGAQFVEIVDLPWSSDMYRAGERRKCRYRIDL